MLQLAGRMLLAVFICLSVVACEKEEEIIYETPFSDIPLEYKDFELEVFDLVNKHRATLGLNSLNLLNIVSKEAESHSIYMAKQELLSHDNFEIRTKNLMDNAAAINIAENVGFGYRTASDLLNGWLNSPAHCDKIEAKRFTDIGISAVKNKNGIYYITQIFIER